MTDSPTPSRYQWSFKGVSFDFYRLCEILGIKHHAQAHALKKVIRAGQSVKSLEQDIDEAIACLMRWKEMVIQDGEPVFSESIYSQFKRRIEDNMRAADMDCALNEAYDKCQISLEDELRQTKKERDLEKSRVLGLINENVKLIQGKWSAEKALIWWRCGFYITLLLCVALGAEVLKNYITK